MSITKDQAQMLATLAAASRPNGARRWDHAGIMAALAKIADRSLPEIILGTIRAAADRDAQTPGIIPSPGSHWAESATVRPYTPVTAPTGTRCTICGEVKGYHNPSDHEYSHPKPRNPEAVTNHINELRRLKGEK